MHTTLRLATGVAAFLCVTVLTTGISAAQSSARLTRVTFDSATRVPGAVLAPGVYEFSVQGSGPNVVMIRNVANGSALFLPATAISRTQNATAIGLRRARAGVLPELATWYPNGNTGYQFAPAIAGPSVMSTAALTRVDDRLSVADIAVADARAQLKIAESRRRALRVERRDAR